MNNNIISFKSNNVAETQNNKKSKNKSVNSIGGTLGGIAAGGVVHLLPLVKASNKTAETLKTVGTMTTAEDKKTMHDAVKKMLTDSGLNKKGVRIKFLSQLKEKNKLPKNPLEKFCRVYYDLVYINSIREGDNAAFFNNDLKLPKYTYSQLKELEKQGKKAKNEMNKTKTYIKGNSVCLSKDFLHTAGFHELGHALNWNFSKFGRFLQKNRAFAMNAPIALGIYGAISKKSKPKKEGKNLNHAQKTNNFIRDNIAALSLALASPLLIEEGMASFKGQKYANKLLSPNLAKKVLKANSIGFLSYLGSALFCALGAYAAVKIKDYAVEKKEAKLKKNEEFAENLKQMQTDETRQTEIKTVQ